MSTVVTKSTAETKDFTFDWSADLGNDTINTSAWSSSDPALTVNSPAPSVGNPATNTTVWLGGGVDAGIYTVTNTIVTSRSRQLTDSIQVLVQQYNYL